MGDATMPRGSGLLFDVSRLHRRTYLRAGTVTEPEVAHWDDYVRLHPEGTIFHTHAWRKAVERAFGHQPVFLSAMREGRLVGVLPMFQVDSRFLGRNLVSMPYAVGGGILGDDEEAVSALFESATRAAQDRRCNGIDLRSETAVVEDLPVTSGYVGFQKRLPDRVEDVLAELPRKARAAARNARRKYNLSISYGDRHLRTVWKLYCRSMRRLGSLNYPYAFLDNLVRETPGEHWVSLVRWRDRPVAGLVTFLFRDTVMPYFVGFSSAARRCSAANFIYLCTMERAVSKGYAFFDFGRSREDNRGSYDFKRFQGFSPHHLQYQYYTCPGRRAVSFSASQPRYRAARRLWSHLPLVMTRPLGAYVARHFPG